MIGMLRLFMVAESAVADMSRNENTLKCQGIGCNNDAIGSVSRDPLDHVSWSAVVTPRNYCLSCYNESILDAFDFIRREK